MGYYLLLYHCGKQDKEAHCWQAWDHEISNSLVEGGEAHDCGRIVTAKEAFKMRGKDIAGYRIIKASNYDEAVEISKGAPPLQQGGRVEVYQVNASMPEAALA